MQTVAEARKKLESINPFEYNITILSQQPGIGKSTWARKYCNDHLELKKIGIISKRHNFLTECESEIKYFSHWEGRGRLCNRDDIEWFKKFDLIYDGIICRKCSKIKVCKYPEQFKYKYLFSWNDIPGNDNAKLIEFLKQNFDIDWVKAAKIEKIDDNQTIRVSTEKHQLSLKRSVEKKEVNLEIDDVITDKFIIRSKNGKLEIYTNKRRVGAPTEYLETKRLERFDILFIEEKITETRTFCYAPESLERGLKALIHEDVQNVDDLEILIKFCDAVKNEDYEYLDEHILKVWKIYRKHLIRAIHNREEKFIKEIQKFDLKMLEAYLKYGKIYNFNKKEYSEPRIFRAFDLAKSGTKIVLLHAGFDEILFADLLERYNKEFGKSNLTYQICTSNVQNLNTKCYQITNSGFGRFNFIKNYQDYVEKFLIKLSNIYYKNDIYIITYKEYCQVNLTKPECIDLVDLPTPEYSELAYGFDSMHFGSTTGLNRFENKDVLVIIGTYSLHTKDKVKKYNELYNENLDQIPYTEKSQQMAKDGKYPEFIGEYLFTWEDIQGNDRVKFTDFLKSKYGLEWIEAANLAKTNNDKTIMLTVGEHFLSMNLNDEDNEMNLKIDSGKTDKFVVKTEDHKMKIYEEDVLEVIHRAEEESEMYDAIHRTRGLIHDKIIFVLGKVPDKIKRQKEFYFKTIEKINVDEFLTKTKPCSPYKIDTDKIRELIRQKKNNTDINEYTNTDIAIKLNIKLNRIYDTQLIESIRNHVELIRKVPKLKHPKKLV